MIRIADAGADRAHALVCVAVERIKTVKGLQKHRAEPFQAALFAAAANVKDPLFGRIKEHRRVVCGGGRVVDDLARGGDQPAQLVLIRYDLGVCRGVGRRGTVVDQIDQIRLSGSFFKGTILF